MKDWNAIFEDFADLMICKSIKVDIVFENNKVLLPNYDSIVKNAVCQWLDKWMTSKGIVHIHNHKQASPDFWLDPDNLESNWLEIKSFTGSPNFDIAAFRSFINLVIEKP